MWKFLYVFSPDGKEETIGTLLKLNPTVQNKALSNEIDRLTKVIDKDNNALDFVHRHKISKHKKVAYANMVYDHRPLKEEKDNVRLTLGQKIQHHMQLSSQGQN